MRPGSTVRCEQTSGSSTTSTRSSTPAAAACCAERCTAPIATLPSPSPRRCCCDRSRPDRCALLQRGPCPGEVVGGEDQPGVRREVRQGDVHARVAELLAHLPEFARTVCDRYDGDLLVGRNLDTRAFERGERGGFVLDEHVDLG